MMIVRVSDGQSLDKEFMYVQPEFQNLNLAVFWVYSSVPNRRLFLTWTKDTKRLNLKFFAAQIQIRLPNKYLGVGYKGLVFTRNIG